MYIATSTIKATATSFTTGCNPPSCRFPSSHSPQPEHFTAPSTTVALQYGHVMTGRVAMAPRPCLDCGTPSNQTRCSSCEARKQQARNATRTHYQGDWPAISREIREAWVNQHGWVCPGWHRDPHPSTDLVTDHVTQRSRQALTVLCRTCNSRKSVAERNVAG